MVRPTVALYAKPDGVSIRLVETLISNFCLVRILSSQGGAWTKALSHISQKNSFQIIDPEKEKELASFEYLILIDLELSFSASEILNITRLAAAQSAKILVILPFAVEGQRAWQEREKVRGLILKKIPEAGIVYAGDLYGPRYFGKDKNFITRNITSAVFDRKIESLEAVPIFPILIEDLCRFISKSLFSFGPYGKEVALYSSETTSEDLNHFLSSASAEVSFKLPASREERQEILGIKKVYPKSNFHENLKDTLFWMNQNIQTLSVKKSHKTNAFFVQKGILGGLILLLLMPFLLGATGVVSVFLAINSAKKGKFDSAKRSLSLAKIVSNSSEDFLYVYSQIPLISKIYKPLVHIESFFSLSTDVGLDGIETIQLSRKFVNLVLGKDSYDSTGVSQEISVKLDKLYQETSFLVGEISNLNGLSRSFISNFLSDKKLEDIRQKILYSKGLVEKSPEILGKDTPKTYLVLFQNNMELRPTGGFIGSYALVSFDSGRLIDINVSDVYAADGRLKGHIEPPTPIRKYLGEANWFLRDSNWDPDFAISADRAEWFLDKEIDKQVDGVIGVDLAVVKGFLRATGPVVLADYNQVYDYKNIYEQLENEVESDFFPGSQKKTGLMTALTKEIMNRMTSLEEKQNVPVAKEIFRNLEERHIQIFFNDQKLEETISRLGYSGKLLSADCSQNCFTDWYAEIDANLGVTKANYFIERSFKLEATLSDEAAKKTLEITYKNTANSALGLTQRYRTYTRIFVPDQSQFGKIKIENAGEVVETDPEIETADGQKSGGVNLEVSPGQTKKLTFSWETPLPQNLTRGGYSLYIRKQAGTDADPLTVSILTQEEAKSYNTTLVKDFVWTH